MQAVALPICHCISATPQARQDKLWQDLFSNPDEWWDNRADKKGPSSPDFKKKNSREPLWLNSVLKPSWVDGRLAALDQKKTKQKDSSSKVQQISHEIEGLCRDGHLDKAFNELSRIDALNLSPPPRVYMSLLQACIRRKSASHAKTVYAHLQQKDVKLSGLVGDCLAMTLAKCSCLEDARTVFDNLPSRTVFSWTAMIRAYVECGNSLEALQMYVGMQEDGVEPDNHTFVSLLKACGETGDLHKGKELHEAVQDRGFSSDAFIRTTLVSMYCKCGAIAAAENLLLESQACNIESVNAMLSAYVENGHPKKALLLFRQLPEEGIKADDVTFNVALQACTALADMEDITHVGQHSVRFTPHEIGQALHADSKKGGFSAKTSLGTTLVKMYGKCGTIEKAENAFCGLSKHDVISWSSILSAYVEHNLGEKSLQVFRYIQQIGIVPDRQAFAIAFQACGTLAEGEDDTAASRYKALQIGKALHLDAWRRGFASDVFVGNTIVSMYCKCGDYVGAEGAFDELLERNTVSWNVLLSLYIEQGMEEKALQLYFQMQEECIVLNEVTLVCALQSCSGTGCLEVCRQIHFIAASTEYESNLLVSSSLIYAYGMCASMADANIVFNKCLKDDIVMWNACIAGYSREGDYVTCVQLFKKMQEAGVRPDRRTLSSILSVCAHAGLISEGVGYFASMKRSYGITPDLKHYVNVADLFARSGDFERLEVVLCAMPMQPDSDMWACVLAACRAHGNMQFGKLAFNSAIQLQSKSSGAFVLLSNILVDADDEMLEFRKDSAGQSTLLPPFNRIAGRM
ncbi:hypothetical protein GOP47_0009037 [Adiantum capillus-veneris]|uniref:Pentatricopeptide repeat-containing protein n=1 Tax=Adiantum capillus-veneris TaxID=13818 RepID=A0A9D4ZKA0_ADICA|nr:hypothetical protein GOP47_0009037 [Adiantum capillus-veneris]